jgi:hypothetical protein
MRGTSGRDDILQHIGELVGRRSWDELIDLRDRCRNLAPDLSLPADPTALVEYHLCLNAPSALVAAVLNDQTSPAVMGPLTEVSAMHNSWAELGPLLTSTTTAQAFAAERAMRGERISGGPSPETEALALPYALQPWEPHYPLADYRTDQAFFPAPPTPLWSQALTLPEAGEAIGDPHVVDAFADLVRPWLPGGIRRPEVVTVEGDHLNAIAALGVREVRLAPLRFADALALMGWAGAASGGQGARRGAAQGRAVTWWAVACLAGIAEDWPIEPAELGEIGEGLHWFQWEKPDARAGWAFCLAVHDDIEELGLAVSATNTRI